MGDLTIRQHLTFYARLRGVDRKRERALVQRTAEMVTLDGDSFDKKAGTLSGGTKRRLSVAISLIGMPRVWLLDEPTTGLSVEAKREVWGHYSQAESSWPLCRPHITLHGTQHMQRQTLLVVSHSHRRSLNIHSLCCLSTPQEETDTLADRIGIMCNGELQAIGTPNHLKQMYGDGFKLTLHLTADTDFLIVAGRPLTVQQQQLLSEPVEEDERTAPKSVTRRLPGTSYRTRFIRPRSCRPSVRGECSLFCRIRPPPPRRRPRPLAPCLLCCPVFDRLDAAKGRLLSVYRVVEWGPWPHASLEEVFVNIVKQAEERVAVADD